MGLSLRKKILTRSVAIMNHPTALKILRVISGLFWAFQPQINVKKWCTQILASPDISVMEIVGHMWRFSYELQPALVQYSLSLENNLIKTDSFCILTKLFKKREKVPKNGHEISKNFGRDGIHVWRKIKRLIPSTCDRNQSVWTSFGIANKRWEGGIKRQGNGISKPPTWSYSKFVSCLSNVLRWNRSACINSQGRRLLEINFLGGVCDGCVFAGGVYWPCMCNKL